MHLYIYDYFLNQSAKHQKLLAKLETRLTDLGLNGKIIRLGPMQNISKTVADEINRGIKTIIAVGNDETVNKIIQSIAGTTVVLGIFPLGDKNKIALSLGINNPEEACDILAARLISEFDLGIVNNKHYFIANAKISTVKTTIDMDAQYSLETKKRGDIVVANLPANFEQGITSKANPFDGKLELLIQVEANKNFFSKKEENTILPFNKLTVRNTNNLPIVLDWSQEIPTPAEICLADKKISVIVNKNPGF